MSPPPPLLVEGSSDYDVPSSSKNRWTSSSAVTSASPPQQPSSSSSHGRKKQHGTGGTTTSSSHHSRISSKAVESNTNKASATSSSSSPFVLQTRHDLQEQIRAAQRKLELVERLDRMKTSEAKFEHLFGLIDEDGSGTVDAAELAAILRLRNSHLSERESLERAANMVAAFDADGNAELDLDEFKTFIATMLQQLKLDPHEFVEFLIYHIAFPRKPEEMEEEHSAQQPKYASPRRSAASKTAAMRPRASPRTSVSSSCSVATGTTLATEASVSSSSSSSTPASPLGEPERAPSSSPAHPRSQPARTVVSVPKRVRNAVGATTTATGAEPNSLMARKRASTSHAPRAGGGAVVVTMDSAPY